MKEIPITQKMVVLFDFIDTIGIYKITNLKTGGVYIGQTTQFPTRIYQHLRELSRGKHKTLRLQESFTRFGSENFSVELIEECEIEQLLERELFYIKEYKDRLYNTYVVKMR